MPDHRHHDPQPPRDWQQAFAALPPEAPPAGGWDRLAAKLAPPPARSRAPLWLATAAILLLAVALPWRLWFADDAQRMAPGQPVTATDAIDPFQALYAESAQLETLLAAARDERVSSASAALLAGELDLRLAAIDATLAQPELTRDDRLTLWQERVDSLRTLTGFESNRRWLVAQGAHYDGVLVAVD